MTANFTKEDMLFELVEQGREELAVALIKSGGISGDCALSAFYKSCHNDRFSVVKTLLEYTEHTEYKGSHVLAWASYHGNIEMMEYLLSIGYDVNANRSGAVLSAIVNYKTGAANWLLENGADEILAVENVRDW